MRAAWVEAERTAEVREAIEGWHRAKAITEEIRRRMEALYPLPDRPSLIVRLLARFFVSLAVFGVFGVMAIVVGGGGSKATGLGVCCVLLSVGLVIATELLRGAPRLSGLSAHGATSFWAVVFGLAAAGIFLSEGGSLGSDRFLTLMILLTAIAFCSAAWRWGSWVYAAIGGCALFLFLGRLPAGRLLWIVVGSGLALLVQPFLDRASLAPSHRRSAGALLAAALIAVYAAANRLSLDERLLEELRGGARDMPGGGERFAAAVATALLPALVLLWGVTTRRSLLLALGALFTAASLVTLRFYVHVAPLWVILAGSGIALIAVATLLERFLASGPGRERAGFTGEPLFSDEGRAQALQAAAVIASLTPAAQAAGPSPDRDRFVGGGGSSGGAGASTSF